MIPAFELVRAHDLSTALTALAAGATPFVGGTELVAAMQIGLLSPEVLVDLKRVEELDGITESDGALVIGAATRHDAVAGSALVREHAPPLHRACSILGNQRVRASGSVGGNLCFADHRSDVTTALFALGASVTLSSADATRSLPIDQFVLGEMYVDRAPDELLVSVEVPFASGETVYVRHQPAEYPTACVVLVQSRDGFVLVVGALSERPERLEFRSLDEIDPDRIGEGLETLEDLNGSAEYKQHLGAVFVRRAVDQMRRRIDA